MTAALLVVDVQRGMVDGLAPARRSELLGILGGLIGRARELGVPVVYIRHDGSDELIRGSSEWEIACEIAPRPGEAIVAKRYRDAFRETELGGVLARLNCERLIVCGMQTEFCVDATIREAERRGYRVTLVEDAHATYAVDGSTEEQIRAQVHRVARGRTADIVPSAELWRSLVPSA